MPRAVTASPRLTVRLFKTISRATIDGDSPVSMRYAGKDEFIDLTPFLGDGSVVRTSKSVREPAGGFSITITDQPQKSWFGDLESISGLVEPMDLVEIRMWNGVGTWAAGNDYPIIMRGFVSEVHRNPTMSNDGRPQRSVTIVGQDYGKIWQTYQVIYLAAYAERKALLTNFNLWDLFGVEAKNAQMSYEFVRAMIEKVINPHLDGFMPDLGSQMPRQLTLGADISVKHGVVNNSYQNTQGSIYDILRQHGDVGYWNELYTEDREDGVHVVYRAIPALHLTAPAGKGRKIQDDAPDPVYVEILDEQIVSAPMVRTDSGVANFYWVNNSRFDLIDEMQRKLASIPGDDGRVSLKEYPNTAVKYYGVRAMYADTQQGDDTIFYQTTGQTEDPQNKRTEKHEAWLDKRRRILMEMNKDNVVFERGTIRLKGGPMRDDGVEAMKAGDYALVKMGRMEWEAYVVQVDHEFVPLQGYFTTLHVERGTGFAERTRTLATQSPWIFEQARR